MPGSVSIRLSRVNGKRRATVTVGVVSMHEQMVERTLDACAWHEDQSALCPAAVVVVDFAVVVVDFVVVFAGVVVDEVLVTPRFAAAVGDESAQIEVTDV